MLYLAKSTWIFSFICNYWCFNLYIGAEVYFAVQDSSTAQRLPYDYESVMHFVHNELSISHKKSTIIPRNHVIPLGFLGMSKTGTGLDFLHINLLYCGGKICVSSFPLLRTPPALFALFPLDLYYLTSSILMFFLQRSSFSRSSGSVALLCLFETFSVSGYQVVWEYFLCRDWSGSK